MRHYRSLLKAKYDIPGRDISNKLLQQPAVSALGTELMQEEVATALQAMENKKETVSDSLSFDWL